MGFKSRARLAADWFAKLRQNELTQEVEHTDVQEAEQAATEVANSIDLSEYAKSADVDEALSNIGGGKVLQVQSYTYTSSWSTSSTSYQNTPVAVTITPTSATSKIYMYGCKTLGMNFSETLSQTMFTPFFL